MRILFTCVPGFGHFHPMVPLAQALVGAGHEVAFATAPRFCERVVEPAGFTAFPAGLSPLVVHEQTLAIPELADVGESDVWRFGAHMFAGVAAPAKVGELVGILDQWPAQLVVHDMTDFAGPIAAAHAGIPWAGHSFGAVQPEEFWDAAGEIAAPTWEDWGVEPGPRGGMFRSLYLDICPPSFQAPAIRSIAVAHPLRPVAFDDPGEDGLPAWVEELAPGATVYVTLGTINNQASEVFETVLEGLADENCNVIVTIGPDRHPDELGPRPANVHVERYLPQSLLFARCDVVVCHGGSGTTLAALAQGLPLLVLPQGANQFWNADRCVELGVGTCIGPAELTPEAVREAVRRLLADQAYRHQASRLAEEIAAMPAPADVVGLVEGLVAPPDVPAPGSRR
ncbi:MAG: glycosyltransferase [Acidimicrobiales bacterium]